MSIYKTSVVTANEFDESIVNSTYTKVGSPTIVKGTFSNMDNQNYVDLPFFDFRDKAFSINVAVNFTNTDLTQIRAAIIGQGTTADFKIMTLASESAHPRIWYGTTGTSWTTNIVYSNFTFKANQDYYCQYIVDKSNAILMIDGAVIHKAPYAGITYDIGTNVVRLGNTIGLSAWKLNGSVKNVVITLSNEIVWTSEDSYLQNRNAKIGKTFMSSNSFYEL